MVFPGFRSNNFLVPAFFAACSVGAFWEFNAAIFTPIATLCFPEQMGRYNAGVVPGVNERGNRQYLRFKGPWENKKADYSKYIEESK